MSQPNILMIISDQMTPFLTGAYGHPIVQTPALNSLAENGIRFDTAYTPFPLCSPARACFMTGNNAAKIGAYDNGAELRSDIPTFAHHLTRAGYDTVLLGQNALHRCGSTPRLQPPPHHRYLPGRLSGGSNPNGFTSRKPKGKITRPSWNSGAGITPPITTGTSSKSVHGTAPSATTKKRISVHWNISMRSARKKIPNPFSCARLTTTPTNPFGRPNPIGICTKMPTSKYPPCQTIWTTHTP